jgi:hypothetical protein
MTSSNTNSTQEAGTVTITIALSEDVAWQFAQFCKRSTFDMFYSLTEAHRSPAERTAHAYQMIGGIDACSAELARAGIDPR